ncbi:MAG: 3-deoxy-8-phosphooctulonate synthase [Bacteroidales bacterium]|nr:3-deoxy-8-phosphooctulonate synthase [Bacteroidales bacterium]MBN2761623.1 3-deoxy-8-phosphooctulonate synthase [Bacteroidales bacterium]
MPGLKHTNTGNFFLIAGPCVIESKDLCFEVAEKIVDITDKLGIPYIFKSSYKKANRSKLDSFTGIGDKSALEILRNVKKHFNIPVLTDIHTVEEAYFASQYADVLQIPAFLCRQTDLLIAAAKTGKTVNIKKGQFLAPESMKFVIEKIMASGNNKIIITDRGTMFGYNDLIVDFRGLAEMKKFKFPVVLDVTHSLQQPNQLSGISGGKPELIETMARAAIAIGVDGIFIETHPEPMLAKSDASNMLKLNRLDNLLEKLVKIRKTILDLED